MHGRRFNYLGTGAPELWGILRRMPRFYNKTAMKVTVGYVVVIVGMLIWAAFSEDGEGQAWSHLFLGFPWVIVTDDSPLGILLFVTLNAASLYLLALIFIESAKTEVTVRSGK